MFTVYEFEQLSETRLSIADENVLLNKLAIDTRKIIHGEQTVFFCLPGPLRDGHSFIPDAYDSGVRNFVVEKDYKPQFDDCNYFFAEDVLKALQNTGKNHCNSLLELTDIGITGSNGKTIVKEWLYHLLQSTFKVFKSPRSYNSAIGVPLSLCQIQSSDQIAIIEAGVSSTGDMEVLKKLFHPQIGIITNIGDAHADGFPTIEQKLAEKLTLFEESRTIIFCGDQPLVNSMVRSQFSHKELISWGEGIHHYVNVTHREEKFTTIRFKNEEFVIHHEVGNHYFENVMHCLTAALYLGVNPKKLTSLLTHLPPLFMRLEHIAGNRNCLIINDAYVADQSSLTLALDHAFTESKGKKTSLILTDFAGISDYPSFTEQIQKVLSPYNLNKLITVGKASAQIEHKALRFHYPDTMSLYRVIDQIPWDNEVILIKGARKFRLDSLVEKLEKTTHSAKLEIDVTAIHHNLQYFKSKLKKETLIIPVLKAAAYGSGVEIVAREIANHDPAFIAVAHVDEAVHLRNEGISNKIIVLNPDPQKLDLLFYHDLQPAISSLDILDTLSHKAAYYQQSLGIHLKLDTGMHRLGFHEGELDLLCLKLKNNTHLEIETIFSHLSASDLPAFDEYTQKQADIFERFHTSISQQLNKNIKRHLLNSEGILRHPNLKYDYARLGIGLYGISAFASDALKKVHTLTSKVIHIRDLKKGDAIGYNLTEVLEKDTRVAIVNVGYADGLLRCTGNRKSHVWYKGTYLPFIGNICMDVSMIDISAAPGIQSGDEVEIFGKNRPIEELAKDAGTIPYEILTRISPRIIRKYVYE